MNLILFSEAETQTPLPLSDPRAQHLLQTLRRRVGDTFDAGILNGPRTKGTLRTITPASLVLDFEPAGQSPELHPLTLLVGLPRPQTARKILQEITSLGLEAIHFVRTDRGEPSYAASKLWTTGEHLRLLIAGAEQAFTTRIPQLQLHDSLTAALTQLLPGRETVALDNYEATGPLRSHRPTRKQCLLAVGSERGWSPAERDLFRAQQIPLLSLGANVLRTETASLCAATLLLAQLELI